jgi:hypothetical protein
MLKNSMRRIQQASMRKMVSKWRTMTTKTKLMKMKMLLWLMKKKEIRQKMVKLRKMISRKICD